MRKTDIEHLHLAFADAGHTRRTGNTTRQLHEIAGAVEIGHDVVYCESYCHDEAACMSWMLQSVMEEHDMKVQCRPYDKRSFIIIREDHSVAKVYFVPVTHSPGLRINPGMSPGYIVCLTHFGSRNPMNWNELMMRVEAGLQI